MKRGRDEIKTYSITVIMTGESAEYCCSNQVAVATDLTKEQFEYCLEFNDTVPAQRNRMFMEMLKREGEGWPFQRDGWKVGHAIFEMEQFEDDKYWEDGLRFQPWFRQYEKIGEALAVPRDNHAVIWINLSE